jgi:hypothetical protein
MTNTIYDKLSIIKSREGKDLIWWLFNNKIKFVILPEDNKGFNWVIIDWSSQKVLLRIDNEMTYFRAFKNELSGLDCKMIKAKTLHNAISCLIK